MSSRLPILFSCSSSPWIVAQLLAHNASATQLQKMPSVNPCARLVLHGDLVCDPRRKRADCITKGEERLYLHWLTKDRRVMVYEIERGETYTTQLGMLRMALNMDEYWMVLELNGAKFL